MTAAALTGGAIAAQFRMRVTGVALAAAGWAATLAAVIAGSHLGRGAAVQIIFAATMSTWAMCETLLSPALPGVIDDRVPPGAAGRYKGLGTLAVVSGCILGPLVGRAALGAGWGTTLLTTVAAACAVASIAAGRLARQPSPGAHRIPVMDADPAPDVAAVLDLIGVLTARYQGAAVLARYRADGRPPVCAAPRPHPSAARRSHSSPVHRRHRRAPPGTARRPGGR